MKVVEFQALSYSSRRERRGEKGGENTTLICRDKFNELKEISCSLLDSADYQSSPNGLKCILMISLSRGTSLSWYDEKRFIPFCLISPTA